MAASAAKAGGGKKLRPSRLTPEEVAARFPLEQVKLWTPGWLPLLSTAAYIRPDGVELRQLLTTRVELRDAGHELHREMHYEAAAISSLRVKSLVELAARDDRYRRLLRKVLSRDRCPGMADVVEFFNLRPPPSTTDYRCTPYASMQEFCLLPIQNCSGPNSKVYLPTFGAMSNLLHVDFDSLSAMKALHTACGDTLVYTSEFVSELALYLSRRLRDLHPDSTATPLKPILLFFEGSGRLAQMLNESGVLPTRVLSVLHRDARKPLWDRFVKLPESIPASFRQQFPSEQREVTAALLAHEPSICMVGPHSDRDYLCDIRGFRSVREVLCLGQVDSPAMGSAHYPWLTWGCVQGDDSYFFYTDKLRKISSSMRRLTAGGDEGRFARPNEARAVQGSPHPVDPPFQLQGYERVWVDEISRLMLHPNDTLHFPSQGRCLAFRRVAEPRLHRETPSLQQQH